MIEFSQHGWSWTVSAPKQQNIFLQLITPTLSEQFCHRLSFISECIVELGKTTIIPDITTPLGITIVSAITTILGAVSNGIPSKQPWKNYNCESDVGALTNAVSRMNCPWHSINNATRPPQTSNWFLANPNSEVPPKTHWNFNFLEKVCHRNNAFADPFCETFEILVSTYTRYKYRNPRVARCIINNQKLQTVVETALNVCSSLLIIPGAFSFFFVSAFLLINDYWCSILWAFINIGKRKIFERIIRHIWVWSKSSRHSLLALVKILTF